MHHSDMIKAHFNPRELDALDHFQGWRSEYKERDQKPMRIYSGLEEIAKNPHLAGTIHRHTRSEKEANGHMHRALASDGIDGDTELAIIGPHLKHFFDAHADSDLTRNPYDGHPQYFSLTSFLTGLGKSVNSIGNSVMGGLGSVGRGIDNVPYAGPALGFAGRTLPSLIGGVAGGAFGGPAGGALGSGAGSMLSHLLFNQQQQPQAPAGQSSFSSIAQSPSLRAFADSALPHIGQNIGGAVGGPLGRAIGGGAGSTLSTLLSGSTNPLDYASSFGKGALGAAAPDLMRKAAGAPLTMMANAMPHNSFGNVARDFAHLGRAIQPGYAQNQQMMLNQAVNDHPGWNNYARMGH